MKTLILILFPALALAQATQFSDTVQLTEWQWQQLSQLEEQKAKVVAEIEARQKFLIEAVRDFKQVKPDMELVAIKDRKLIFVKKKAEPAKK